MIVLVSVLVEDEKEGARNYMSKPRICVGTCG